MKKNLLVILCTSIIITSCTTEKKLVQTDLYFGSSQNDGSIISDSVWNTFVQKNVSKVFSTGFTVQTAEGKWVNENDRQLYSEPSHIIISLNKMNAQLSKNIDSLRLAYKTMFRQQSVLRVDKKVTASF
jgi:hypothetical protein